MSDDFQGRGGSPWGTPPGGGNGSGRGPTPPDIDAIIKDIQNKINKFLPPSIFFIDKGQAFIMHNLSL